MSSFAGMIAPSRFSRLVLSADLVGVAVALGLSVGVLHHQGAERLAAASLVALVLLVWVVLATGLRHYDLTEPRSLMDDVAMATVLVAVAASVVAAVGLFTGTILSIAADRFLLVLLPLAVATRMLARHHRPSDDAHPEKVLVVGVGPLGRATAAALERRMGPGSVAGFLNFSDEPVPADLSAPVLGTSADLAQVLERTPAGEVYLAGHASRQSEAMQKGIAACETVGMPFALPAHDFRLHHAVPADAHGVEDGYLHFQGVEPRPKQMALKRLFDIAASGGALCVLSPLLLAAAAVIRLTSKGPILFRQARVGLHGRTFQMLKFRSMVVNAEGLKAALSSSNEQSGPVFKMRDDPRVTPIGRFIRKHSIDELPQLFNVLRGEMSVVGPRPPVASEVARYQPWQRRRLSVRPGLTCIWQVSGRNQIGFDQWMFLDLRYIDHWTLMGDARLILRTFPVVLTGHGAS
jgi:exopolysaccharide biosynthesis polyprenyl glycosylphosphotransferase